MPGEHLQRVLDERRRSGQPKGEDTVEEASRFYSIPVGDAIEQNFLEFRFNTGIKLCLAYHELVFFDYDPEEGVIDLEFGVAMIVIRGRGLAEELFEAIKRKRVSWIREADRETEDHRDNKVFVKELAVIMPSSGDAEGKS